MVQKIPASALDGSRPFRNLIINGDMSIAQRGTSKTGITSTGNYVLDRFKTDVVNAGTWTLIQSTDVPTGQGFGNSLKFDCTTADGSLASGDRVFMGHRIEDQFCNFLKKGTSSAESVTVSFWVRSNKTGTYICELFDSHNTRGISKSYTIDAADTWEKKIITFEGDTTGAFANDNGIGFMLQFWLAAGTDYTSGTLATSWQAYDATDRAVGQLNLADSTSNEWYLTGVQLEAGDAATDFEFLPFDVQLQRCMRYYEKSYNYSVAPGTSTTYEGTHLAELLADGTTTRIKILDSKFLVRKRAAPTMTFYTSDGGASGEINNYSSGADKTISSIGNTGETNIGRYFSMTDAGAANEQYEFQYEANAEL